MTNSQFHEAVVTFKKCKVVFVFCFIIVLFMFQVEYVDMLEEQSVAYKKAVDEYRALAEAARAAKALKKASINLVDALPRRQVTNIFTQLRKVRKFI
jgi:hypothetical protein